MENKLDNKTEIIEELKRKYSDLTVKYGLKTTLEEYENIYGLEDSIRKDGFVSESLSFYLVRRSSDFFYAWYNYMHSILMPQPSSILQMEESSFIEDDMKKILRIEMRKIISIIRKVNVAIAKKDFQLAVTLTDDLTLLWASSTKDIVVELSLKASEKWSEEEKEEVSSFISY